MPCGRRLRTLLVSFSAAVFWVQALFSQEPGCTERKLPVYFRDAQHLPISDISVADLEAKVQGRPVKIVSLAPDLRPGRLVLILDISGTMSGRVAKPSLWDLELSLASHFFESNRRKATIALLSFNDEIHDVIGFSEGNAAVGERLRQLMRDGSYGETQVKGKTALRDAILQGIQLLDHPSSADAICVLTDGGDNASRKSVSDLEKRLAFTSVRLFSMLLYWRSRPGSSAPPEAINGPAELVEITHKSGGEILTAAQWNGKSVALSAGSKVSPAEMLNRLYQAITQRSLLEVELPAPISKNQRWELKLSSTAQHRWKNATITYPDTLISCNTEVYGTGRK